MADDTETLRVIRGKVHRVSPRLPLAPLLALYDSALGLARALKVDPRQVHRWSCYGVSIWTADELAIGLGFHPIELWPRWVEVGEEAARQRRANRIERRRKTRATRREARQAA